MSDRNSAVPAGFSGLTLRQTQIVLLGILAAGLAWRLFGVIDRSLWYDEAKVYFVSRFALAELFNRLRYDSDAPLYYLFLKAWTPGRASPFVLRLPSVIFGILTILGAYRFTAEALRSQILPDGACPPPTERARETGLWAAALVAFSVFQIRWSWEINRFALGAALAVWSSWALFRALHAASGKYGLWLLYTVLALVFGWTDYLGLFTIAAQWLFIVGYLVIQIRSAAATLPIAEHSSGNFLGQLIRHPHFEFAARSAFVLGLALVVWLHFLRGQLEHLQNASWMPPPGWATAGGYTYHAMVDPEGFPPQSAVPLVILCAAFCVAVPLALLWKAAAPQWYVFLAMVVSFGSCLAAAAFFDLPIFFSRYFLYAHLFLLIGAALLIGKLRAPWARRIVGGMLLAMTATNVNYFHESDLSSNASYRGAVAYVESRRSPGDPVVVCDHVAYLPMLYYVQKGDRDNDGWYMFGSHPDADYDDWVAMGADNVIHPEDLADIATQRVWVVDASPMHFYFRSEESTCDVPVPANWMIRRTKTFDDLYGVKRTLKVVEYEVVPAAEVKK